jgi:hypothetical protein
VQQYVYSTQRQDIGALPYVIVVISRLAEDGVNVADLFTESRNRHMPSMPFTVYISGHLHAVSTEVKPGFSLAESYEECCDTKGAYLEL